VISWVLSGTVPGWTSLTLLLVMISSVQLLVLGLIGEYVGRTYIQSKNRPLFMISHIHRRPRLAGPLPHDPAFVRNDFEKSTLQPDMDADPGEQVLDEIGRPIAFLSYSARFV
jgi:polyisoprenyl-phosphate glycosyltransferase